MSSNITVMTDKLEKYKVHMVEVQRRERERQIAEDRRKAEQAEIEAQMKKSRRNRPSMQ